MFDWISSTASSAWEWMNSDSGQGITSAVIGGAATAAGGYYLQKDQQKYEQKYEQDLYNRQLRDRDERYGASKVTGEEYGSHNSSLTGGMLTQGKIASLT